MAELEDRVTADSIAQETAAEIVAQEQEAQGEYDWIPQQYRRSSLEETTRFLLENEQNAKRKISAQGKELAELRDVVASYEAAGLPELAESYGWEEEPTYEAPYVDPYQFAQPAIDPQRVNALAQEAVAQALVQSTPIGSALIEGEQIIAAEIPGFRTRYDDVRKAIETNPELGQAFTSAVQTGNPAAIAGSLRIAYDTATSHEPSPELMRTMKLQAQSASGAGGRPGDSTKSLFQEVMEAPTGKLNFK